MPRPEEAMGQGGADMGPIRRHRGHTPGPMRPARCVFGCLPRRRARCCAVFGAVVLSAVLLGPRWALAKPIRVTLDQDMAFGQMAANIAQVGTVTIDAGTGAKTTSPSITDMGGLHGRAIFTVTGDKDVAYSISLPGSATLTAGGDTVTVDTITSNPSGTGVLAGNGRATLNVGARLNLGVNQAAGSYSGTFDVTVNYQ